MKKLFTIIMLFTVYSVLGQIQQPTSCQTYSFSSLVDSTLLETTNFTYDSKGNLLMTTKQTDTSTEETFYTYDNKQNPTFIVSIINSDTTSTTEWKYDYDNHNIFVINTIYYGTTKNITKSSFFNVVDLESMFIEDFLGTSFLLCDSFSIELNTNELPIDAITGRSFYNTNGDIDSIALYTKMVFTIPIGYLLNRYDNQHNCISSEFFMTMNGQPESFMIITSTYNTNNQILTREMGILFSGMESTSLEKNIYDVQGRLLCKENYFEQSGSFVLSDRSWYNYTTNIKETLLKQLSLYPNPASDNITINIENNCQITIFDISGKKVSSTFLTEGIHTIDISALPVGCYILKMESKENNQTVKIIKQ